MGGMRTGPGTGSNSPGGDASIAQIESTGAHSRASRDDQTTDNQRLVLEKVADTVAG